jgi:cobalt-zinc-cadmium efflux system outer membrane protein
MWRAFAPLLGIIPVPGILPAQTALDWEQVRERFRTNNPSLMAGSTAILESRANEVTAGLRPNPQFSLLAEQFHPWDPGFRPFQDTQITPTITQLWERRGKRGLRVSSARLATSGSVTDLADQERQLTFNLRDAFIRTLQAKSIVELATDNLSYYDKVIDVNRLRYKAGDISRADLDRVELQRAQYESDLLSAQVNVRTAKIQLLALMNDKTPVDQFDIRGNFDFRELILLPDELRAQAAASRPDLQSANTAIRRAEVDHKLAWANGSTDPVVGGEYQRTGPFNTLGLDLTVPLRIFDRNQGEKARTALEIRRTGQLRDALSIGILRDVDSALQQVQTVTALLRPYRDRYLPLAASVRDTVSFAFQRGGASLLDFLDAQKAYRDTQLNYRNLIASWLSAANQLNLAVGQEVIP